MISFIYEYPLHEHDDSTKSNVNFLLQANYHIENNEYMMSHINQVFSLKNEKRKYWFLFSPNTLYLPICKFCMTPKFVQKSVDSPQIGECSVWKLFLYILILVTLYQIFPFSGRESSYLNYINQIVHKVTNRTNSQINSQWRFAKYEVFRNIWI